MERFLIALFLIHSIQFCYQQDINVCPIGTNYFNGACVRSPCPDTHHLVNGACLLIQTQTASCGYGFDLINGICVQQNCPSNFIMINGLCQEKYNNPPSIYCPNGFYIQYEMCFPNSGILPPPFCRPKPCRTFHCPFHCDENVPRPPTSTVRPDTTSPTTTTKSTAPITTTTTTTKPTDICPPEYVIIDGECRVVSCLKGTFYRGRCLEPVCAGGLVWTGMTCTQPEVITTILEIKNNIITETNRTGPDAHASKSINNIIYLTETNEEAKEENITGLNCTTTPSSNKKCCIIITPRMCKKYGSKWVCFNRQYRQCGEVCGTYSVKYIRIPKVIENPGMLVIPPNPVLKGCSGNECKISDAVDCSGCLTYQKETCSPYCYRYRCPNKRCTFIDQNEYCTKYRGSPGCSSTDGCFENYCYEEIERHQECL